MTNTDLDRFESALLTELRGHVASQTAMRQTRLPKHRRLATVATATTAVVLGLGGVAYATGLVPDFVTDAFSRLDATSRGAFDVSGIKPVAAFALPDGTAVTVWRGHNDAGGSCEAVREDREGTALDTFHASCFDGDSRSRYEAITFSQVQDPEAEGEPQNAMYFIAYGEAPSPAATRVRITGDGADTTLKIDPTTSGFGGHLAGLIPPPDGANVQLMFEFTDATGNRVDLVEYRDGKATDVDAK